MKAGRAPSHGGDPATFASSFSSSAARQKREDPYSLSTSGEPSGSPAPSAVRRKPLPPTASPLAARLSQSPRIGATGEENNAEGKSLAYPSPALHVEQLSPTPAEPPSFVVRDLDRYPHGQSPPFLQAYEFGSLISTVLEEEEPPPQSTADLSSNSPSKPNHATQLNPNKNHNYLSNIRDNQVTSSGRTNGAVTMSLYPSSKPPNLSLSLDANSRDYSSHHDDPYDPNIIPKPKSPGGKFTSFFSWKTTQSPGATSSSTAFSDKSSPAPSPLFSKSPSQARSAPSTSTAPLAIDIPGANESTNSSFSNDSRLSMPPTTPGNSKPGDMEEELRQITSELASSIRREMDLEDLVDRLQLEANQPPGTNRRTSDYFSDSGNGSIRYPQWDSDSKQEELEKLQRKAEQEKAQLRLELTQRVQEERSSRRRMETYIRQLQEQVSRVDQPQAVPADASERIRELEGSLEDARRCLLEERQVSANFKDLLGALQNELQGHRNERDNLRDEVIPQLQARVEGLESEAAEVQRLTYENTRLESKAADLQKLTHENTRLQQELQSLRNENSTLINARKLQLEMQQQQMRFNSIAEEGLVPNSQARVGLTRSNTVARNSISGASWSSSLPRSRSNSLKDESRETLAERVKDSEDQRDALHLALKSLLERQEYQERESAKKIRALELERDRVSSGSRRIGYDRNIWLLREEVNHLRRRADEALLQKWQCEKGLGGLKMDLDRAEQETSSLRRLLQEHDILIPESVGTRSNSEAQQELHATSASLEKAYKDLQATHALSLARIEGLEPRRRSSHRFSHLVAANSEAEKAMELLKQSITDAEVERDLAQKQAEEYRQQADALQEAERGYMMEEQNLADQLRESAVRIEGLAGQVRQQLASNSTLRERLAEAISRGEREQRASAARINEMQNKLKSLEDRLMTAQQHSEEAVSKHEEEIKGLRETHNAQLQRMKNGLKSPSRHSPNIPHSPLFAVRSPKLDLTTSGRGISISEVTKTGSLEKRVEELENALSDADKEMEEVVGRMNMAQIEVMELQSERDEAMRQTRKLQSEILQEREKVKAIIK